MLHKAVGLLKNGKLWPPFWHLRRKLLLFVFNCCSKLNKVFPNFPSLLKMPLFKEKKQGPRKMIKREKEDKTQNEDREGEKVDTQKLEKVKKQKRVQEDQKGKVDGEEKEDIEDKEGENKESESNENEVDEGKGKKDEQEEHGKKN
ncbi:cilia- and flagella-associated protein 251-like [Hydractinia symbiolongicarpus]|uniref:cilia- and flagella-associated protein 251-like n=1 Tax=Hydractinia symbiolongicarpus TaxID=13093 RepID=UPI00254C0F10|nr:cilia- and flagella-associated protein 251-like [Hydractinia symbiolongicarpus]XP_057299534.1 cilia- and flagella-associated protein 251-like [Hydractinia symbiolongicarpus]